MTTASPALISFGMYLLFLIGVGLWHSRQSSHSIEDYILGGRKMGPTVTALSVNASDMSSWLLMALPGTVFLHGMNQAFIGLGLIVGSWLNWFFISQRLRIYTQFANNALTLPEFFEHRFEDQQGLIRVIASITILLFFTLYVSAGIYSGALLFENILEIPYLWALLIGSGVIVFYTFIGGFLAVSWTDFFQGCLMLCALLLVPAMVFADVNYSITQLDPQYLSLLPDDFTWIGGFSALAWGLGYFGQPHILSRFMAIESPAALVVSRRIAIGWQFLALGGAVATGLAGALYYHDMPVDNAERIFLYLSQALFSPWVAGLLIAAILSAIMSTVDSQLLVCTSVLAEDLYKKFLRPQASQKELIWISRLGILLVSAVAIILALDKGASIQSLVMRAWGGFGASFGTVIILSLFWHNYSRNGALATMISGALTVILWQELEIRQVHPIFELYELIPGFVIALTMGVLVSKIQPLAAEHPVRQQFKRFTKALI